MAETIKGLNIKLGLDTSDLDQKLKNINSELKEEQKDLRAINNALKFDSNNIDKWREKQTKLNSILDNTKKRLEVQNKRLEEAKKALQVGAISQEQFNQVQRSIQYTETDIIKLNNELKRTEEQIKRIGGINTSNLKKVGTSFTKYVTAPIVAAATALSALTFKSMKTADEMKNTASKIGMSVEAFQEWSYVAKVLAVDSASLEKAFVRTNSILGEIAIGSDKYSSALSQLEITSESLLDKTTDEAFEMIRDALSRVEDQTLRTALANEIFGENLGNELSLVLQSTASEIDNLRNKAKELGIVTSEEAEIASNFRNSLDNLKQSASALAVTIGVQVVPVLQKLVDNIQSKAIPAVRNLVNWWANLSTTTKRIITILLGVLAAIGPVINIVLKLIQLVKTIKGVMSGGAILKFFQAFSFGKIALIGLIATLAVLLLQNEKFKEVLKQVFNSLSKILEPVGELISSLMTKLEPVLTAIVNVFSEVIDVIVILIESIMPALTAIIDVIVNVLGIVIEVLLELIDKILPVLISLVNEIAKIIKALKPIFEMIINLLGNIIGQAIKLIEAILPPIMRILDIIIQLVGTIIGVLGTLINAILAPLSSILDVLTAIISVVISVLEVLINIIAAILAPVLKILFAILEPILSILMVFIEIIGSVMELLAPLIETLLTPLIAQLDFIAYIFEALAPLIMLVGEILGNILAPVLEVIFALLEPILWILEKIIDAAKWIIDNVKKVFDGVGNAIKGVGNFFGDLFTGKLFQKGSNTTNNTTNNSVTVNTTSSTFDINSINKALGGAY